jgi:hypothetical protein
MGGVGVQTQPEPPAALSDRELLERVYALLQRAEPLIRLAERHPLIHNLLTQFKERHG